MKKGFDRLKGLATASVMGLGCLAAGSGRAATVTLATNVTASLAMQFKGANAKATWSSIGAAFSINEFSVGLTKSIPVTTTYSYITASFVSNTPGGASVYSNTRITVSAPSSFLASYAFSDAFDSALILTVDGNAFSNPDNVVDLTNNVLTSDVHTDIVTGIDAQVELAFDFTSTAGSLSLVRALYTFTNTSGADINTTVNISGNLGSDSETTIQASSSGDLVSDDTDMWTYSNDRVTVGKDPQLYYDPGLIITRYGSGASVVPTQTEDFAARTPFANDSFGNDYDLTIPAGQTQRILVFIEGHSTNAAAVASAASFETLAAASAANHLTGLSATQLAEIVNYGADADLDGTLDAADNCPLDANIDQADGDGDGIGDVCDPIDDTPPATSSDSASISGLSMSLPGLFAMLGMLPVLRLLRKTKP